MFKREKKKKKRFEQSKKTSILNVTSQRLLIYFLMTIHKQFNIDRLKLSKK